jgi:hypothetical protein
MKSNGLKSMLLALFLVAGLYLGCSSDGDDSTPTTPTPTTTTTTTTPGATTTTTTTPGPTPTCSIVANPQIVRYGEKSTFNVTITSGPANGSFSPGSGECSSFTDTSSVSCETASLTTSGENSFTFTVSNAGGSSTCTANAYVGCQNYRVWNNIAVARSFRIQRLSFADFCTGSVPSGSEITASVNERLLFKGKIMKEYAAGVCGGAVLGTLAYDQAMNLDSLATGGDGDCRVNFVPPDR